MNKLLMHMEKQIRQTEELVIKMRKDLTETLKDLCPDVTFDKMFAIYDGEVLVTGLEAESKSGFGVTVKRKVSAVGGIAFAEAGPPESA